MDQVTLPAWAQVGVAGAALATLVYVFLGMRSLFREFMRWTGNHMSLMSQDMRDTARANQRVADAIDDVARELERIRREG